MMNKPLRLNVIPLEYAPAPITCSFFYNRPHRGEFVKVFADELPAATLAGHCEFCYTDFTVHKKSDGILTLYPENNERLMRIYLSKNLHNWFKHRKLITGYDFIRDISVYVPGIGNEEKNRAWNTYRRFGLKVSKGRFSRGYELGISYKGQTRILAKNVLQYQEDTRCIRKVLYNNSIQNYRYVAQRQGTDNRKVYPVLNRDIAAALSLPLPTNRITNRLQKQVEETEWFWREFMNQEAFITEFSPQKEGFIRLDYTDTEGMSPRDSDLEFGNGVIHRDPYAGIKAGGPYAPAKVAHIKLFFIVHESKAKAVGNDLYKKLKYRLEHFPGLNDFIQLPLNLSDTHISFRNADNPLPEIKEKLAMMEFEPDITYGVVYISPINKYDTNPNRQAVYYRVKELLLKYRLTSQVILEQSPGKNSFAWYLPNIAVALLAKLGGIPWKLHQPASNDLVIGVGAYRSEQVGQTYLGSAFSFDHSGIFRGFSSFREKELRKLAASFQKAIVGYWNEQKGNNPERVVIHFYKRMNKKEAAVLMSALRELKLQIPLVIATIYKEAGTDYVLTDTSVPHYLPISGTWLKTGKSHEYILCANTRYADQVIHPKDFPLPYKVLLSAVNVGEGYLNDTERVRQILTHIYQFGRLNWQTVKIKNRPVTMHYPELVARKVPFFSEGVIPEFGTRNLWFL